MLNIQHVSKKYGKKKIFTDLSFTAANSEIIGLVGENGAGKSTLLQILATMVRPNGGNISLGGIPYKKNKREIRKLIGFVPQEIAIWEAFTVAENMQFFARLSWNKRSVEELRQLCLSVHLDKWNEPVKVLSGGMKRKLNLAISLIHQPMLLLLDEPTVGIDLKSKIEIVEQLQKEAKEHGKIIIYTSHDMQEMTAISDTIICIGNDPFYPKILEDAKQELIVL